jgi:hypothetical protein
MGEKKVKKDYKFTSYDTWIDLCKDLTTWDAQQLFNSLTETQRKDIVKLSKGIPLSIEEIERRDKLFAQLKIKYKVNLWQIRLKALKGESTCMPIKTWEEAEGRLITLHPAIVENYFKGIMVEEEGDDCICISKLR